MNRNKKVAIVLGTRPEIIKMSSVIRELQKRKLAFFILHTNQHYSKELDSIFFRQLELPCPKYNLNIGSDSNVRQTAKMMMGIEEILVKELPDVVLVQGDTNSVLAGALAAAKLNILIGHLEAGLRSYFDLMPEEKNRILTDHCSGLLFAPTRQAVGVLVKEGISKAKIFLTGNTIVDAVFQNCKLAESKSNILKRLHLNRKGYFLVTVHRQENVDIPERLKGVLDGLGMTFADFKYPIIYPIHPRTIKMIKKFKLKIPRGIKLINPLGYFDFLQLEKNAGLILTDSGGVQEEACILKIPCVTLRDNTERLETLIIKSNILAGVKPKDILCSVKKMLNKKSGWVNPYGDGRAAQRIIDILEKI